MTTNPLTTHWDVVIVGGGSAGLSAALILARARRSVLVLDGGEPRNRFAPHVHGVLARDGYSPLQLVEDGRREVRAADGVVESATVATLDHHERGFELETTDGARLSASRVIVATGIRDELPAIPGLAEQWGRGVVACPYCDGFESRGRRIGVIAGSVAALHKAQLIRAYSSSVTVYSALVGPIPDDDSRALEARGIRIDDRPIARLVSSGDDLGGTLTGIELDDGTVDPVDVVFADPRPAPLDGLLRRLGADTVDTPFGPFTATDASFQTSIAGVWAVGNVSNPSALVPIAAAAGVTAAVTINAELVAADVAAAVASLAAGARS
jgi:thioredoxin reductase